MGMDTKICFKCDHEKPLIEFYKHKRMADGHLNKCKDCTKNDEKKRFYDNMNNLEWKDNERKRNREKYYRLNYREKQKPTPDKKKEIMSRYKEKYPEKLKATRAIGNIPCKDGNNLHHWSYNPEHYKDVIELSMKNHFLVHRYMIYDPERMMYRTLDGVLMDTKEKHLNYINYCIENYD